ncbi:MAG: hypothetical protein KJO07_10555 [Deltaproteobacteria bacterium]|nr:hypothetical protein [Deltaproteobacteria bacterium]
MKRRTVARWAVLVAVALVGGTASADIGKKVRKRLAGKILITEKALPTGLDDDNATVKKYKSLAVKTVKHEVVQGIPTWNFHYTAFLKTAPKVSNLAFDFYTTDKKPLYVADKRFTGVDPKIKILSGVLTINEDDNVNKNRTYVIKLTGKVRGREKVFATTKVTFK